MIRRRLSRPSRVSIPAVALVGAAALACTDPTRPTLPLTSWEAFPIVNGTFDGNGHPAVGALLFDFDDDGIDGNDLLCSGSLIAPTVFLTAGHCLRFAPAGSQFHVTFDNDLLDDPQNVQPLIAAVSYAAYTPGFVTFANDIADIGVVILPVSSTSGITPVSLPAAGLLTALAAHGGLRGTSFEAVGYGVSATTRGPVAFPWNGMRNATLEPFKALNLFQLGLHMNANATGQGGDCYGDSGSPKFLPSSNTIVAVTSWGDATCRSTSWSYRLDTPSARTFLASHVSLP